MKKYITKQSSIKGAGKGLFTNASFKKGEVIGLAHVNGQPTKEVGSNHNHNEKNPTANNIKNGNKRYLIASRNLKPGEEITTNYRLQPELEQPEDFKKKKDETMTPQKDGYRTYSPFKNLPYIDVKSDTIDSDDIVYDLKLKANNGLTKFIKKNTGLHTLPGAKVIREIPVKRKGGSVLRLPNKKNSKRYSRSLSATNKLFTQNFLFEKPKSRKNKVFDPNSKYYAEGGEYEDAELTPEEIEEYRANGYIVDDTIYQDGGELRCLKGEYWNGTKCVKIPKNTRIVYHTDKDVYDKAFAAESDSSHFYNNAKSDFNKFDKLGDRFSTSMSNEEWQKVSDQYYKLLKSQQKKWHTFPYKNGDTSKYIPGYTANYPYKGPKSGLTIKPVGLEGFYREGYDFPRFKKPVIHNIYEEPIVEEKIENLPLLKPSLIQQKNYELQGNPLNEEELELPNEEVESEYLEEGGPDTENPMEWVNKRKYDIDWNGIQIPYRLPRFRKPGAYGPLTKPGKQRYINLPKITSRNTAYLRPKKQDGGNTDAMNGMMKARLAYANEFGNPAAERMINIPDNPYQFDNGDIGTHYMASYDNYAVPQIQDQNGELVLGDYGPESNEAIRFDSDEDANYFAENYKDVSPGFIEAELDEDEIEEYRKGGYIVEEINTYQDGGVYTVKGSKGYYKKVNGKWQVDWNRSGKYQPLSKGDVKARTAVLDKMAKPAYDKDYDEMVAYKNLSTKDKINKFEPKKEATKEELKKVSERLGRDYKPEDTKLQAVDMVYPERYLIGPGGGAIGIARNAAGLGIKGLSKVMSYIPAPVSGALNAYFGAEGIKEFADPNSLTRKSMSRAYDNPTWSNIGDAAFDVGMNSLNFVGLPFNKAFKGTKNLIKGFKRVPKQLSGSPNAFKSEINWNNWNKEIPKNKPLMQEYTAIEETSKANGTWMKNPDGTPFNGTPEQFVQQQSQNFKNAFGDIPPKISYRGDNTKNIQEFKSQYQQGRDYIKEKYNLRNENESHLVDKIWDKKKDILNTGIYTTDDYNAALKEYAKGDPEKVSFLYTKMNNPKISNTGESFQVLNTEKNKLISDGYDGLITPKSFFYPYGENVLFNSNQLKSATGNNGMFDITNPNIYKSVLPIGLGLGATQYKQGGTTNDYIELDLTPEEIQVYKNGGYIVEEIDNYQKGGPTKLKYKKPQGASVQPPIQKILKNPSAALKWSKEQDAKDLIKKEKIEEQKALEKAKNALIYNEIKKLEDFETLEANELKKPEHLQFTPDKYVIPGSFSNSYNPSNNIPISDNTNIYRQPIITDWSLNPKYKKDINLFLAKKRFENAKATVRKENDSYLKEGPVNHDGTVETVGQFNKRQSDWEHSSYLNKLFTEEPANNYWFKPSSDNGPGEFITGIGGKGIQAIKWLKPLWNTTKTAWNAPIPLGKTIINATAGTVTPRNLLSLAWATESANNQVDSNSDVVNAQSNFFNNPSLDNTSNALYETAVNSLGFSGLGLGKQVFKPTYNASKKLIKGFKRVPKQLPGSPNAVSSADDVVKAGFDGNFLTRPLTLFTKNELTQGNQLYRKIGNTKGLQDLINKGGAQAPAPMRMNSGQMLDTPFFGIGNKPNENYGGLFAVETALPSKSKYDWSSRVGGTNNYGVAPIDPTTGRTIQNIPLEDLEVFRKKWFSNSYRKLDKQNLQKELKSANLQELSEKLYKWGIRGYIADQILNDGDLTGGKAVKIIEKYFEDGAKQYEKGGIVADLTPEEIQDYIDGGYVVKEIDNYQNGGVNKKGKSYDYTRDPTYTERFKRFFGMEDVDDIAYEKVDDKNIKKYKQTTKPIEKTIRKIPTIETKSNFELDLKNRLQNIAKENILKEKNISKVEPIKNSLQITKNNNSNIKNKIVKPEDSFFESTYKEIKSFNNWLDNQKKVFDNGVKRKFQTWGVVETKDKKVIESPEPLNVKDYYKNPTLSQTILNVNDQPNRQFKQQTVPTSNLVLGSRNRGQYQDIESDGLEFTTFHPFSNAANIKPYNKKTNVNGINDDNSVFALDNKGVLHTGIYKNLKHNKDWKFSRTFMNKIVSIDDISLDGSRSGNHKFWQPQITILENNKLKKGALNILTKKGKAEEDYYGSILGGRVVFVNPLTKEQTLVSGSVSHIKKEFKRLKGNSEYLEAWSLDNGTYARGLSYKDGKLTKQRLVNYDAENTSGGNGLYIKKYNVPVNKFKETYVYDMPNVRTKKDASYKAGHKLKNEIKNFVLHHTAYDNPITNEAEVKKQFMTPGQNSSHVVIEEDGSRTIYASPEQVSFHAGKSKWNGREDVNDFSIGVEFQGDTQKKPLTDEQVISFVEYYAPIAKKYNLNLKSIITHEQIRNAYIKKHANEKGLETKPDITYNQYKRILNYMKAKGIN
jgi:hypothetical protein